MARSVRPWIPDELEWLKKNCSTVTVYEAALHLNRSVPSVRNFGYDNSIRFKRNNITSIFRGKKKPAKRWTAEEDEILRLNAGRMPLKDVCEKLGRKTGSVQSRTRILGISLDYNERKWTKEELDGLLDCERYSTSELALRIGRTYEGVQQKMRELGYKAVCGYHSQASACRFTGYATTQLVRARKALRQNWKRSKTGGGQGRYLISDEQLEELCEWLKNERWKGAA